MKLTLPPDVMKGLPAPSSDDGLVRVTVGIKVGADGEADLVELNDNPLPVGDDVEEPPLDEEAPPAPDTTEGMADYAASASEQLGQL